MIIMKLVRMFSVAGLALGVAATASAQTATQTLSLSVTDVNTVSVSGNPGAMSAAAGGADATDASTTYDVTTNSTTAKKITGYIDSAMPTGTTLSVSLADPDGAGTAGSAGSIGLTATTSATAQDLVTGITQLQATGKAITYVLHADVTAAAATNVARTVTFTIQ
jgi:hypothetical protein